MRWKSLMLTVLGMAASSACVRSVTPITVTPRYSTVGELNAMKLPPACASFSRVVLVDERADKARAGKRYAEKNPAAAQPIVLEGAGDLSPWLDAGVKAWTSASRLRTDDPAGPVLRIRLLGFALDEAVFVNAEYDGTVDLGIDVLKGGAASGCWTRNVRGFSENYGKAQSALNYDQTVNHALDKALLSLWEDGAFAEAACRACR